MRYIVKLVINLLPYLSIRTLDQLTIEVAKEQQRRADAEGRNRRY